MIHRRQVIAINISFAVPVLPFCDALLGVGAARPSCRARPPPNFAVDKFLSTVRAAEGSNRKRVAAGSRADAPHLASARFSFGFPKTP